jgi:hypothetical protein
MFSQNKGVEQKSPFSGDKKGAWISPWQLKLQPQRAQSLPAQAAYAPELGFARIMAVT